MIPGALKPFRRLHRPELTSRIWFGAHDTQGKARNIFEGPYAFVDNFFRRRRRERKIIIAGDS